MKPTISCLLAAALSAMTISASADESQPAAPEAKAVSPMVELSADGSNATIERRIGTQSPSGLPLLETGVMNVGQWSQACVAPCQVRLDPRYTYRVAGEGLVPSPSFALPRNQEWVRVDAKLGSADGRAGGALLTGLGVGALALGAAALVASPILSSEDVGSEGFRTGVFAVGVGAASVGALALGIGLFMWFANGSNVRTEAPLRSQAKN